MATKKPKKPRSIDLFKEVMPAIDQDGKDIWDLLSDEQRKEIQGDFWILNRYISSVAAPEQKWQKGKVPTQEEVEHFIESVNLVYNKNWFVVQKHPKLLWQLICMCAHPKRNVFHHEYIPLKKEKDKKTEFLMDLFPNKKREDVEALAAITTDKDIKQYCRDLGWDQKAINGIKI